MVWEEEVQWIQQKAVTLFSLTVVECQIFGVLVKQLSKCTLIAIPTTAGTGSECQSFALISHDESHTKMACGDTKALPSVTILDPELTLSQPFSVAACTGIDALSHARICSYKIKKCFF